MTYVKSNDEAGLLSYARPEVKVLEAKAGSVLCQSGNITNMVIDDDASDAFN